MISIIIYRSDLAHGFCLEHSCAFNVNYIDDYSIIDISIPHTASLQFLSYFFYIGRLGKILQDICSKAIFRPIPGDPQAFLKVKCILGKF